MEFDLSYILDQDVDLGFKRNYFLDYDMDSPSTYDSNKLSKEEIIEATIENQKNADILKTTQIFENEHVPEGYKLVLEEETGESFLIMINNSTENTKDSNNKSNMTTSSSMARVCTPRYCTGKCGTTNSSQSLTDIEDIVDLDCRNKFFLDCETRRKVFATEQKERMRRKLLKTTRRVEIETPSVIIIENHLQQPPVFLSQVSVRQELEKIENTNITSNQSSLLHDDVSWMYSNILNQPQNLTSINQSEPVIELFNNVTNHNSDQSQMNELLPEFKNETIILADNQTFLCDIQSNEIQSDVLLNQIDFEGVSLDEELLNLEHSLNQLENSLPSKLNLPNRIY
jgi:hypothetical protein